MKRLIALLLVIGFHFFGIAQNFNRPAPNVFGQYEFQRIDTTTHDKFYLFTPFPSVSGGSNLLYIVDEDGYIAWWSEHNKRYFDFKYHPVKNEYLFTRKATVGQIIHHFEMDNSFNIVDSITSVNGVTGDIHEFQIFPNGNRCFLTVKDSVMDLSSLLINGSFGSANTTVIASIIQEFNPSGTLVFEWNSLDHLSPDHYGPGLVYNVNAFDYLHANSIELDLDGNLLLSYRAANMICKINHQTGNVIWKLGGNFSDFTFTNDGGFFGEHDLRVQQNGNLTLFDNDYLTNTQARGVEYQLDTINFTATLVNESNYTFDFSARSLGSYRLLDNDYRIVGWGNTNRPSPSITLIDPQGNIASDFLFKDSIVTYRAQFQALPNFPTRPSIDCQPVGINLELSVSGTHNHYLWSTGQTTPSIVITQPGTYQCWVDQGIGMLGSTPITITSLSSCNDVGVEEYSLDSLEIIGYYDLMGRILQTEPSNTIYFVHYSNGSIQRRFNVLSN